VSPALMTAMQQGLQSCETCGLLSHPAPGAHEGRCPRCAEELEKLILAEGPETIAAMWAEPIMGAGGVILPPAGYYPKIQAVLRKYDILFVCDEVQTGLGRTGTFLALEHWGLEPDLICLAKALSGGLVPIGAVLASRAVMDSVFDGMERAVRHGSTFGGNDLAAAVALATLRVLDREELVGRAERMGALLLELTTPTLTPAIRTGDLLWISTAVANTAFKR